VHKVYLFVICLLSSSLSGCLTETDDNYIVLLYGSHKAYWEIGSGTEYVSDGETLSLEFNADSSDSLPDWRTDNAVGVRVFVFFGEDETSSGLGCNAPDASDPEPDTITATITHGEINASATRTHDLEENDDGSIMRNTIGFKEKWYDEEWAEYVGGDFSFVPNGSGYTSASNPWVVQGLSKSQIEDKLDVRDVGLGDYTLNITVDAEKGGAPECEHTDDGEEVEYDVTLYTMRHWILTPDEFDECLGRADAAAEQDTYLHGAYEFDECLDNL
jgi:hypothetical protein